MNNMNTNVMTQRELEAERDELESLRSAGNLTPMNAKRLQEIRSALGEIERSSHRYWGT